MKIQTFKIHNRLHCKLKTPVLIRNIYHSIFFCNYSDLKVDHQRIEFSVIKHCSFTVSLQQRLIRNRASFRLGALGVRIWKAQPKGTQLCSSYIQRHLPSPTPLHPLPQIGLPWTSFLSFYIIATF